MKNWIKQIFSIKEPEPLFKRIARDIVEWTPADEKTWRHFLATDTGAKLKLLLEQSALHLQLAASRKCDVLACVHANGFSNATDFLLNTLTANDQPQLADSALPELQGTLAELNKPSPESGLLETRNTL